MTTAEWSKLVVDYTLSSGHEVLFFLNEMVGWWVMVAGMPVRLGGGVRCDFYRFLPTCWRCSGRCRLSNVRGFGGVVGFWEDRVEVWV